VPVRTSWVVREQEAHVRVRARVHAHSEAAPCVVCCRLHVAVEQTEEPWGSRLELWERCKHRTLDRQAALRRD